MRRKKNQLSYQLLESRQLLAGDFMVDPLEITLDSFTDGQVVSILQQGGSSVFYLPDGQWNGVEQPGIEGAGTSLLTISNSLIDERRLIIRNTLDNVISDVVFAGDVELSRLSIDSFRSISQTPDSVLTLSGGLGADSVVLREPQNHFNNLSVSGEFVDLASTEKIVLTNVLVEFGRIFSKQDVVIGHPSNAFDLLKVSGELTITSETKIGVYSSRVGVTGKLSLNAPDGILFRSVNQYVDSAFIDFNGFSVLNQLNFQSDGTVTIELKEVPSPFTVPVLSLVSLYGENRASDLNLDGQYERISSLPGTSLIVENHAYIAGSTSIYLGHHAGDVLQIGKRAHFEARPLTRNFTGITEFLAPGQLVILRPGDVRFGWFRTNQSTYVTVFEDDSSFITSIGGQRTVDRGTDFAFYTSGGDMETHPNAYIETDFSLSLVAAGRLSARTSDSVFQTTNAWFAGGEIAVDHIRAQTIHFEANGNVQIRSDSDIRLKFDNRGKLVDLRAKQQITMNPDATLTAGGLYALADSIWLANRSTNSITITGRSTFDAADGFVVIGKEGSAALGQVSFNTKFADIRLTGHLQLAGSVWAENAILSSPSYIGDRADAQIRIEQSTTFRTPKGVYLADGKADENLVVLCGHVFFDVGEFAVVKESGTSYLQSWAVSPGAFRSIAPNDYLGNNACA